MLGRTAAYTDGQHFYIPLAVFGMTGDNEIPSMLHVKVMIYNDMN
jgi:hypothetical protein